MSDYVVYAARYNGIVMYVGEGKSGRESHITSGTSHVYEANKYHFEGKPLDVVVEHRYPDKSSAKDKEKGLILELNPIWNKMVSGNKTQMDKYKDMSKLILEYNITCPKQKIFLRYLTKRFRPTEEYTITLQELKSSVKGVNTSMLSRLSSGSYQQRETFRPLKRKSCIGCVKCGWIDEHISEFIDNAGIIPVLDIFCDGDLAYYHVEGFYSEYSGEWDIYEEGFRRIEGKMV